MGKVIHRELCQKFKFALTNQWYMLNPESILENKMHKIFWDFEMKTGLLMKVRRLDHVKVEGKKRTCRKVDFTSLADQRVKLKESEKKIST